MAQQLCNQLPLTALEPQQLQQSQFASMLQPGACVGSWLNPTSKIGTCALAGCQLAAASSMKKQKFS